MGFIVILILFGILLLLAEILLVPGVGVAGVLGLLSLIGSCIYAFNESGVVAGTVVVAVNVVLVVGLLLDDLLIRGAAANGPAQEQERQDARDREHDHTHDDSHD